MSYCELITFVDGQITGAQEYGNAWGGAARIWDALFNRYLKDPNNPFDNWLATAGGNGELWKLAERQDLPTFERAVHAATFDRATIDREHFSRFAADLRAFVERYPPGDRVCHLLAWAAFLDSCEADAIGFYGTSCSENLWFTYDEERDESVPYDLNVGDKHFEVYAYLAEFQAVEN